MDACAALRWRRPRSATLWTPPLAAICCSRLRAAAADDATGAILIEADGPVFCAGMPSLMTTTLFTIGRRIAKPIVTAVQGVAVSGGLALIANAHVVVAAQGTSFGLTDIREGTWT